MSCCGTYLQGGSGVDIHDDSNGVVLALATFEIRDVMCFLDCFCFRPRVRHDGLPRFPDPLAQLPHPRRPQRRQRPGAPRQRAKATTCPPRALSLSQPRMAAPSLDLRWGRAAHSSRGSRIARRALLARRSTRLVCCALVRALACPFVMCACSRALRLYPPPMYSFVLCPVAW